MEPKNYFYYEFMEEGEDPNLERLCLSIKSHEDDEIILGAFGMIDYYFYFDRKAGQIEIYEEDCHARADAILRKKERIL